MPRVPYERIELDLPVGHPAARRYPGAPVAEARK
jgi:hypothetical protein